MSDKQTHFWEQLIDWIDGRLPAAEAKAIEEQIAKSDENAVDATWFRAFKRVTSEVVLDEPPRELRNALRTSFADYHANRKTEPTRENSGLIDRLVAALNFDSGLQLGLAGTRAGASSATRQLVYSTDAVDISLNMQDEASGLRIDGQILPLVDLSLDTFQATLQKDNETVAQAPVDEFGYFTFLSITPDTYQLTLGAELLTVVLEAVDFRV